MRVFLIMILTMALFLVMILSLGSQKKMASIFKGRLLVAVLLLGILIYSYGFSYTEESIPAAILRTASAVFGMFTGQSEFEAIREAPLMQTRAAHALAFLVQCLALFLSANAIAATFGRRALTQLRLQFLRKGSISLVYGVTEDSLSFVAELQKDREEHVIFIDEASASAFENKILQMGCVLLSDDFAVKPSGELLKKLRIRPGTERVAVYCLHPDAEKNILFAEALRSAFREGEIRPQQTRITILMDAENDILALQDSPESYGFGSVMIVDPADLAARSLIHRFPPHKYLSFDGHGRATEDFDALIVGFGSTGQMVLRQLVMNAQFEGSTFHATVITPNYSKEAGDFLRRYPELVKQYDIHFLEEDARSIRTFREMQELTPVLNYVVICTGDLKRDLEIELAFRRLLRDAGVNAPVILCSRAGLRWVAEDGATHEQTGFYTPEVLCSDRMDRMAMILNHQYHLAEGRTPEEDWAECDYFSRMSCRASADFMDAFLHAADRDRTTLRLIGWQDTDPGTLENLARTEHLRWCAFHYAMGYRPMGRGTYDARCRRWQQEVAETGSSRLRLSKDTAARLHVCLMPWEDLVPLSEKESAVTGRKIDYQEMDRDNIRMIPELIRAEEE